MFGVPNGKALTRETPARYAVQNIEPSVRWSRTSTSIGGLTDDMSIRGIYAMQAKTTFFPLGNADCVRLDLANGQKILVDYAAVRDAKRAGDKRCDLSEELRRDLRRAGRNYYDAVCITHTDSDHCRGFGEFFWLDHASRYQGNGRIKINELWVPAAAILETGLKDDARLVREEARHRLRQGEGVRVFSRPERLEAWIRNEGLDFEARRQLIVDAGGLVPGYRKEWAEQVEFFVHAPFGSRQDDQTLLDRNEHSIVLQATFVAGGAETRVLFASDVDHGTIAEIVRITKGKGNQDRLRWDLMKLPHHCSYLSLGPEPGTDETKPDPDVTWLFETQRERGALIVSTSDPIPAKGSEADKSDQPPHRQAANYHRRISGEKAGEFVVTMEKPSRSNPKPFAYKITSRGIAADVAAPIVGSTAATSTPRAG